MAKQTHKTRLLSYLNRYNSITSLEAIRDLGNTRLGSNFFATAIVHNTKKPIFKRLFVRFCSIISGYEYFFKVLVSFIPKVN